LSDYLLDIGRRPLAKQLLSRLRVPLPEPLKRDSAVWGDLDLLGQNCAVGGGPPAPLSELLMQIVTRAGGRIADQEPTAALSALVFDGTGMMQGSDLDALYDFFKPRLRALANGGRVVLIGNAATAGLSATGAACSGALIGFAKSLAKELGRKGATCQVLLVHPQGQSTAALTAPLVFFLSPRSAFISGQVLHLGPTALPEQPLANSLSKRRALVTGAAHGIGAAICRHLAAEGVTVYGHDRPQEKAALAAVMAAVGGTSILVDLLDPHGTSLLLEQIAVQIGALDLLINNAGITRDKTLGRMPRDYWTDTLTVNLNAPMALSEALLAKGGINQGGRIVFMSSIGGLAGNAGQTNYAAAKAGLAGYIKAAAAASAKHGITINALAPGFIETRMTQSMPLALREVARRLNSLKQAGQPDDVAQAAVFLTLPGAASVNGEVLRVCGQNLIGA